MSRAVITLLREAYNSLDALNEESVFRYGLRNVNDDIKSFSSTQSQWRIINDELRSLNDTVKEPPDGFVKSTRSPSCRIVPVVVIGAPLENVAVILKEFESCIPPRVRNNIRNVRLRASTETIRLYIQDLYRELV